MAVSSHQRGELPSPWPCHCPAGPLRPVPCGLGLALPPQSLPGAGQSATPGASVTSSVAWAWAAQLDGHAIAHATCGASPSLRSRLRLPTHPGGPPGVRDLPTPNAQFAPHPPPLFSLYTAMLWGSSHTLLLKGYTSPPPAPRARWEGLFSLLWVIPSSFLPSPPVLAPQLTPTQPLAPTNTREHGERCPHPPRPSASFPRHAYSSSRGPPSLPGAPMLGP